MRIAVTGASGDMGRALVPYLLERGHQVVALDLVMPSGPPQRGVPRAEFMVVDTRSFGELAAALRGCDGLVHLAAYRSPNSHPDFVVYNENTAGSYNALSAAATLGIKRVVQASSINALGGAFSRQPRYDYFPLDEQHPTYAEDPYSLSKWVMEQQGDAFARRHEGMSIASLRFHMLVPGRERAVEIANAIGPMTMRHLWAYTHLTAAARACLLGLTAPFTGHEAFFIVAPDTTDDEPSPELARRHYPDTPIRGDLSGHTAFFNSAKAERLLGWRHEE